MLSLASGTERRRTPEKRAKTPAEEPPPKAVSFFLKKCIFKKKDNSYTYQVGKRLCPREDEEVGEAPEKRKSLFFSNFRKNNDQKNIVFFQTTISQLQKKCAQE